MDLRLPDRVPDQLKTTINAFNAITEEAEKIPDFKDRMDFYKKCYPTFIGTYVFSYIGRLAYHGYMNEIEDVSWTSAIRRIPMITMVEVGGEFSITFLQNFETPKYADAIAKEMEGLGIDVSGVFFMPIDRYHSLLAENHRPRCFCVKMSLI